MQSDDTLIDFNGSDNDKVRDKRLLRGPSLRVYHQGKFQSNFNFGLRRSYSAIFIELF